jgi:hypothetical protein
MPTLGGWEILIGWIVIILIIAGFAKARGFGGLSFGPPLVLIRWSVDDSPDADVILDIEGRVPGLVAFIMTVLGFSPKKNFKVTAKEISFHGASLSGESHQVTPTTSVASTHCIFSKPVWMIIIGILFAIFGLVSAPFTAGLGLFGGLIMLGIFALAYVLSKKISVGVETAGGLIMGLSFKASVIHGVPVNVYAAKEAMLIVSQRVLEAQYGK